MPKKVAVVDYDKYHPNNCDHGLRSAALACEYENLILGDGAGELERSAVKNRVIGRKPEHRAEPNRKEGV